jgi:hypothetical protein
VNGVHFGMPRKRSTHQETKYERFPKLDVAGSLGDPAQADSCREITRAVQAVSGEKTEDTWRAARGRGIADTAICTEPAMGIQL